jgi:hypothetical protein
MTDWITPVLAAALAFVFGLLSERLRLRGGQRLKRNQYRKSIIRELNRLIISLEAVALSPKGEITSLAHDFTYYRSLANQLELFYETINPEAYRQVFALGYDALTNPSYSQSQRSVCAVKLLIIIRSLADMNMIDPFSTTRSGRAWIKELDRTLERARERIIQCCGQDVKEQDIGEDLYRKVPLSPLHPVVEGSDGK